MKTLLLQKQTKWENDVLFPFDPDSRDAVKEIKSNQTFAVKIISKLIHKQRSVAQFNLFHACLRVVAFNSEDPNWDTLQRAKLSLKVRLNYIHDDGAVVMPDGRVLLNYRSFAFSELGHMEACKIFDRSWPILASINGTTEQGLFEAAYNGEY